MKNSPEPMTPAIASTSATTATTAAPPPATASWKARFSRWLRDRPEPGRRDGRLLMTLRMPRAAARPHAACCEAVPATAAHVPLWIDLAAVAVGGMQGGAFPTMARDERNDFDLLGVAVFALIVGLGGGIVRDVLLGQVPAALRDDTYLGVALAAGLVGMLASELIPRLGWAWDALDAAVVGLFVVVGALKTQDAGLSGGATILLGAVTGVGGSVLRDL